MGPKSSFYPDLTLTLTPTRNPILIEFFLVQAGMEGKAVHVLENGAVWTQLSNASLVAKRVPSLYPGSLTGGVLPAQLTNGEEHRREKEPYIHN